MLTTNKNSIEYIQCFIIFFCRGPREHREVGRAEALIAFMPPSGICAIELPNATTKVVKIRQKCKKIRQNFTFFHI